MKITLSKGKFATIDSEDYPLVSAYKWHLNNGYASHTNKDKTAIWMHRLILNTPTGMMTDHKNGNRLDNRRENLRVCNRTQNFQNKINIKRKNKKGVDFRVSEGCWRARITVDKKQIHLGYFRDKLSAIGAYNNAAQVYFGEFANLNKI